MFMYGQPGGGLQDRKQALIKKLSGQNRGQGGAARLSAGVPFGSVPRLGFSPNARSVLQQGNEQFNFSGGPEGFQGAAEGSASAFAPPQGGAPQAAPLSGLGPAAGAGTGSPGVPQGGGSSVGADGAPTHLLENGGPQGQTGAVPQYVQQALENGNLSGGVSAWLAANPWFMQQLGMGGGSPGGGAVL